MSQNLFDKRLFAVVAVIMLCASSNIAGADARSSSEPEKGVVLITGANRGIGLELAKQYVAEGWQVIGTARDTSSASELRITGAKVFQLDVTDEASITVLARDLDEQPIDLLINNAGIQPLMWKLDDIDFDAYERALQVNTIGPVRVTRALLPNLQRGDGKTIINVTTNLSSIAENENGGFYGYRESKAALNMFNKSLAAELAPEGFICIVLHPGWVRTDLGGPNAPLDVEESVRGMTSVIRSLKPADNGKFFTYAGENMPW